MVHISCMSVSFVSREHRRCFGQMIGQFKTDTAKVSAAPKGIPGRSNRQIR